MDTTASSFALEGSRAYQAAAIIEAVGIAIYIGLLDGLIELAFTCWSGDNWQSTALGEFVSIVLVHVNWDSRSCTQEFAFYKYVI